MEETQEKKGNIPEVDFIEDIEQAKRVLETLEELEKKVLQSPEYRLLYGKTQMFYDDSGRSRGGHSHNIGETSGRMAKKAFSIVHSQREAENPELFRINREIYERYGRIMGFAHDLGHTPLGHDGESVLDDKLATLTGNNPELAAEVEAQRREDFAGVTLEAGIMDDGTLPLKGEKPTGTKTFDYEDYQKANREHRRNGKIDPTHPQIGYEHNEYSAQIFARILKQMQRETEAALGSQNPYIRRTAERQKEGLSSIDPTRFVTAILAHSRSRFPNIPQDLLAQIVRQSDKVEYMNFDFDEYRELGFFPFPGEDGKEVPGKTAALHARIKEIATSDKVGYSPEYVEEHFDETLAYLDQSGEQRRESLEAAMIEEALVGRDGKPPVGRIHDKMDSMRSAKICAELKDDALFHCKEVRDENGEIVGVKRGTITGNNVERSEVILDRLLQYYCDHPDKIPSSPETVKLSMLRDGEDLGIVQSGMEVESFNPENIARDNAYERLKTYLSTLTNARCEELYQQLVQERITEGPGHGIEPVSQADIDKRMADALAKQGSPKYPWQLSKAKKTEEYMPEAMTARVAENMARHREEVAKDEGLHQQMVAADKAKGYVYGEDGSIISGPDMEAIPKEAEKPEVQPERTVQNATNNHENARNQSAEVKMSGAVSNAINEGVATDDVQKAESEADKAKEVREVQKEGGRVDG